MGNIISPQLGEYRWDVVNRGTRMGRYLTDKAICLLRNTLSGQPPGVLLDCGCGIGQRSASFRRSGFTVIGLEYDATPLGCFRSTDPEVALLQADASRLPLVGDSVDYIMAMELVDYLPDKIVFYRDVRRVLRPGGLLLCTLTNRNSIKGLIYKHYLKSQGRQRDANFYELGLNRGLDQITKAGLSIVATSGYNWNLLPRDSNSHMVDLYAHMETTLGLECLPSLSPLVYVVARKSL